LHYRLSYEPEDEKSVTTKEWDLYWHDLYISPEFLAKVKPYQKVNHFPGLECLSRKNLLGKNLMRMKKVFPKEYNFFPPTWILPLEWSDFRKQFNENKAKTFIVKPEALSQGKGIFLTRNPADIDPAEHYVVQRYLHRPFLIDGLKFDLRIYVLVYGCDPYRIYMYKEGLARLATEKYVPPSGHNMDNLFIHLTNYAINKDNENFEFNTDADKADVGHKRSLDFVWRYVTQCGGNADQIKAEIKRSIIKTFCAVQPLLSHMYRSCQPNDCSNDKCFELLGFDIMLDQKFKPWLLEVNHAPSFSTDTPFDYKTKSALLTDTFKLLNFKLSRRQKYEAKKLAAQQIRLVAGKVVSFKKTKEDKLLKKAQKMKKRDEYEMANLGNYERIYPCANTAEMAEYANFIDGSHEAWEGFTGGKKKRESIKKAPELLQKRMKQNDLIKKTPEPYKSAQSNNIINSQNYGVKGTGYINKPRIESARIVKRAQTHSAKPKSNDITNINQICPDMTPIRQNTVKPITNEKLLNIPQNIVLSNNLQSEIKNSCDIPIVAPAINVLKCQQQNIPTCKGTVENYEASTMESGQSSSAQRSYNSRTEYTRKWKNHDGSQQIFASNLPAPQSASKIRPKTRGQRISAVLSNAAPPQYNFVNKPFESSAKVPRNYAAPLQVNANGIYVVPKILEFIPFDIIAPKRAVTFCKDAWNPYRIYKPTYKHYAEE